MSVRQSAAAVLMISPASFAFDSQTALSNKFQARLDVDSYAVTKLAMQEFKSAVSKLQQAAIEVMVVEDNPRFYKPSAVFPNNWISTWPDGTIITYPMATANRRLERDTRVLDQIASRYNVKTTLDLSEQEAHSQYLESTGAIVFDHIARTAYGCLSQRCHEGLFIKHVKALGYRPVTFSGYDHSGASIYHTNVMMGIQSTTAIICSEVITDTVERRRVLASLKQNHSVIDISFTQMTSFCGNVLEIENRNDEKFLVMSQTAYDNFTSQQLMDLSVDKRLLAINIPTIEKIGGGSARCMLAEIFLPRIELDPSFAHTETLKNSTLAIPELIY